MIISIDKRGFVLGIIPLVVLVSKYNMESGSGYYIILFESLAILYFTTRPIKILSTSVKIGAVIKLYFVYMIYRIAITIIKTGALSGSATTVISYELLNVILMILVLYDGYIFNLINGVKYFGLLNALIGSYEFVTKSSLFSQFIHVNSIKYHTALFGTEASRVQSIFIHPTICAVFTVITWVIVLYYPFRKVITNALFFITSLLTILGTQSRSSWIAFLFVNIYFVSDYILRKRYVDFNKIIFFLLVLLSISIAAFLFSEKFLYIINFVSRRWLRGLDSHDASNYNRVGMILMGLRYFSHASIGEKIFGAGSGSALNLLKSRSIRGWTAAVDNTYLTTLMDYGILGFSMLVLFMIYSLKVLFRKDRFHKMNALCLTVITISSFFFDMYIWFTIDVLYIIFLVASTYDSTDYIVLADEGFTYHDGVENDV